MSLLAIAVEGLACRAPETHYVMFLFKVKHACADSQQSLDAVRTVCI